MRTDEADKRIFLDPGSFAGSGPLPFDLEGLTRVATELASGARSAYLPLTGPLDASSAGLLLHELAHKMNDSSPLRLARGEAGVTISHV